MDLAQLKSLKDITLSIPGLYGLELYPFQKIGTAAVVSTPRLLLGDDTGLGKTIQSIASIQLLHNTEELSRNDTLVVCPKANRPDWYASIKSYTALTPLIANELDKDCKYLDRKWNVLIAGYPTIRVRADQFKSIPFKLIILDEGIFRNSESKTFSAIKQLTDKAQRVVILNASSLEINLGEVWAHIEILYPGLISLIQFKELFCKVETKYFRTIYKTLKTEEKIVGFKNLESAAELKKFISKFYIKRTIDEVGVQMPEMVIKNIFTDLLPAQVKEYGNEILKYKEKEIKGAQLLYSLLRICDGKKDNWKDSDNPALVSSKGQALERLVESLGKQQFVLFSQYIDPLLACAKILKRMGKRIGFFTGQNTTRDQHLLEFKNGERDCLLGTNAMQRGLNLENCAHLIKLNQIYNSSGQKQLHGRISRITSKHKNVFIYNLLTRDTVEENVLELLEQREVSADFINEEGVVSGLTDAQVALLLKPRKSLIDGL